MFKVSTPGDRDIVRRELPEVMTQLEMKMPTNWDTIVMHILCYHSLEIIEAAGPFLVSNLLDIERFHTLFKGLARSKKAIMISIRNHHQLMEAAISARMDDDMDWTNEPLASSVAGYASRLDSSDRADRVCRGMGKPTTYELPPDSYKQVQTLWADEYPEYKDLHVKYNRVNNRLNRNLKMKDMSEWRPYGGQAHEISEDQRQWQNMTPKTQVLYFA